MHAVAIMEGRISDQWKETKQARLEEHLVEERWATKPEVVARSMLISTMVLLGGKRLAGYSLNSIKHFFDAELMKGYPGLKKPSKLFDQERVDKNSMAHA
jgi:hypothetical protein